MKTAPLQSNWYLHVYAKDLDEIDELEKRIKALIQWQATRLRDLVTTSELSVILSCQMSHASDLRSGKRNLTKSARLKVLRYLKEKHKDAQ